MSDDPVREAAQRLYALAPGDFMAARKTAVAEARDRGARDVAKQIGALRKPTLSAWALNLLVHERPDLFDEVTALGTDLRLAQAQRDGDRMRELTRARARVVHTVTTQLRALAADRDQRLSDAAVRQAEETVRAAIIDADAAQAWQSGLLAQPISASGLDALAEVLALPVTLVGARRASAGADDGDAEEDADTDDGAEEARRLRAAARKRATDAVTRHRTAAVDRQRRLDRAGAEVDTQERDLADVQSRAAALEVALAASRERRDAAAALLKESEESLAQAERELAETDDD